VRVVAVQPFALLMRCCRVLAILIGSAVLLATAACGSDSLTPTFSKTPLVEAALAAGQQFNCALTSDGKSYCWGDNLKGQLGDSSFIPSLVPVPTVGGHPFVAIAAAYASVCALDRAGTAWCWGDDPTQPGLPLSYRTVPIAVSSPRPFKSITVGAKFGCGLDVDGAAFCWGINSQGQLGVGDTVRRNGAVAVQTGVRFSSIVADFFSACGLTSAGAAWCWGDNSFGELGTGDINSSTTPRAVSGSQVFRALSSGPIHECGLTMTGAALCWGNNSSGQLGDGTGITRLVPTPVIGNVAFTSIRSSRVNSIFTSTCGVTTSGDAYCWGYGSKGQLGTAPVSDACTPFAPAGVINSNPVTFVCSYKPAKIAGVSSIVAMDVGLEHICTITATPSLVCWGDGAHGELGDGNGIAEATPVQVKGGLPLP
jgi:alpha-tubulin suppressor-like RCC1 family protein